MGVHIRSKEGRILYEATNGHMLIKIESNLQQDDDLQDFDIIVPATMVRQLSNKAFLQGLGDPGSAWHTAVISGQSLQIECLDGLYQQKLIDGTFPETENVVPKNATFKGKEFEALGFNINYVAALARSVKIFSKSFSAEFAPTDHTGPATFRSVCDRGSWLGVLMPIRV